MNRHFYPHGSWHSLILAQDVHSEVNFGASEGWGFFCKFHKQTYKEVLLQGYGTAAAGSSSSGTGEIFPTHYKECRLVHMHGLTL